ncbi:MAG: hypothetical protein K6F48_11065 [Paludibacteraceae bacterium]|nr:hypothetical protein [Paludibacteraceae bacterium]
MKAYISLIFFLSVMAVLTLLCLIFPSSGITIGAQPDPEDTLGGKVDSLALDSIEDARLNGIADTSLVIEDDSVVQYESNFLEQLGKESVTLTFPSLSQVLSKSNTDNESAESKLRKAEEELRLQIEQDSLDKVRELQMAEEEKERKAFEDTLKSYQHFAEKSSARIYFPNDDFHMMDKLFVALQNCGRGPVVHILHYGDSQIESDRITGYVREQFQKKFGGSGPGTCPAIQPIRSYTVVQTFSDSLPRYIADGTLQQKLSDDHYGVLAQMAKLRGGKVTLGYTTCNNSKVYNHAKKFSQVRLLVGNTGENFTAKLRWGKQDSTQVIEAATPEFSVLTWKLDTMVTSVKLDLSGTAELYGVAMDGKSGVAMDNIPLRGSSGTFFTRISSHLLSSAMKELNVKLILLEFGGNYTPHIYSLDRVEKYKQMIASQIRYLRNLHPGAMIILIGPADMSQKINGELQTYPFLEENIEGMKQAALENGAAFWDMYQVMGGRNSMIKWVEHVPAWAASDYIHFTPTGAGRIADMFVQSFMNYYDYYCFLKRNKKWSDELRKKQEEEKQKQESQVKQATQTGQKKQVEQVKQVKK